MMNRRIAMGSVGLSLLLPGLIARGQQRPVRLGWLSGTNPRNTPWFVAFERRLKDLGHIEGKNLNVDFAFVEGKVERLAPLAQELVANKPDVLFTSGPEAPLKALSEATSNIPIVVCAVDFDPQAKGTARREGACAPSALACTRHGNGRSPATT